MCLGGASSVSVPRPVSRGSRDGVMHGLRVSKARSVQTLMHRWGGGTLLLVLVCHPSSLYAVGFYNPFPLVSYSLRATVMRFMITCILVYSKSTTTKASCTARVHAASLVPEQSLTLIHWSTEDIKFVVNGHERGGQHRLTRLTYRPPISSSLVIHVGLLESVRPGRRAPGTRPPRSIPPGASCT